MRPRTYEKRAYQVGDFITQDCDIRTITSWADRARRYAGGPQPVTAGTTTPGPAEAFARSSAELARQAALLREAEIKIRRIAARVREMRIGQR